MKKLPPGISSEIGKCIKCGQCRTVCPIFADLHREKYASRGKLALIKAIEDGQLPLTPGYGEVIDNCLLCLACVDNCSSGVRLDKVITAARTHWAAERGLPVAKRLAYELLNAPRALIDATVRGGSIAQALLFDRLPPQSGLRRRFPFVGKPFGDRYIPPLAQRPFFKRAPHAAPPVPATHTATPSVIFFSGCLINYVYPHTGEALINVFRHLGVRVIVPPAQNCCGTPAKTGGDPQSARQLARKNIACLSASEAPVITACGSCGRMLRNEYPSLFEPSDPAHAQAGALARRIHDVSEYLVHHTGLLTLVGDLHPLEVPTITYHDPCHLGRGMGVTTEPRQLLHSIAGNSLVEMTRADRCCGSGGLYGLTHPKTSRSILRSKTDAIRATGAKTIVTGCPGCIIQLRDGIRHYREEIEVCHIIETLAGALAEKNAG